jgi:hypothetical protein
VFFKSFNHAGNNGGSFGFESLGLSNLNALMF